MNLEQKLKQDAELIALAKAWKKSKYSLDSWTEEDYMIKLKEIPLWDDVKEDLDEYAEKLSPEKNKQRQSLETSLLKFFPKLISNINLFLKKPFYKTSIGTPLTLKTILLSFKVNDDGKGIFIADQGDCRALYQKLQKGQFTQEELLKKIGIDQIWEKFERGRKIPLDIYERADFVISHFLNSATYETTKGIPVEFDTILCNYMIDNKNQGEFFTGRGYLKELSKKIQRGETTKKDILEKIGKTKQWEKFEKGRRLPADKEERAKFVLEHFLKNPIFKNNNGHQVSFETVIRSYRINESKGEFVENKGDCKFLYRQITRGVTTKQEKLRELDLEQEWEKFEFDSNFLVSLDEKAKNIIGHFLKNPTYEGENGCHITFSTVLRTYTLNEENQGEFISNGGDLKELYQKIQRRETTKKEILEKIGKTKEWEKFENERRVPVDQEERAKFVIEHFLENSSCQTESRKKITFEVVLCSYKVIDQNNGVFTRNRGDCNTLYRKISTGELTKHDLLKQIECFDKWDRYEKGLRVPIDLEERNRFILEHFLQNPVYETRNHFPITIRNIFSSYRINEKKEGEFVSSKGDCFTSYKKIILKETTEKEILEKARKTQEWNQFLQDQNEYLRTKT